MRVELRPEARESSRSRRFAVLSGLGLAGLSMVMIWSAAGLAGLPDVGDPFDVAAFVAPKVVDDDNAYVLYKQAVAGLPAEPPNATYDWPTAAPAERRWLDECRPAMEVWRKGTERPDAEYVPLRDLTIETQLPVVQGLRQFVRLSQLEAGRMMEAGDLEGAWRWYRAMYRSSRHVGRRATMIERLVGTNFHTTATHWIVRWAADPRVDAAMLRRALDAAIADDALAGPLSDNLKAEYLAYIHTDNNPDRMLKCLLDGNISGPLRSSPLGQIPAIIRLQRVMMKEPERSRRVLRLVFANLLSWSDIPSGRRPPVACSIPNPDPASTVKVLFDLRTVAPSAPAAAQALSAAELARWFDSTLYARQLLPSVTPIDSAVRRERAAQARLILTLANGLYARDHGKPPERLEELVGPYLDRIPEEYQQIEKW